MLVLLFLMLWIATPKNMLATEVEDTKAALDAFNRSVEDEVKKKIQDAEAAEREGKFRKSQNLMRQAMLLETLKVDEGRISEEKILALKDQMSSREKKDWMNRFVQEGDRLASFGLYDLAVDEYEKVFLFEPENAQASRRIDRIRKKFIKEETQSLKEEGRKVDEEVNRHSEIYLNQARELIQGKDFESAKKVLEHALELDKKNKEAKKLLKEVRGKLEK
ncbi:MAG: hypothetical protein HZC17_09875 [Candidatus Omnitrophica bacterium]|nr:hypothetical protein [Candidatus Omnitrophota bacterium]